LDDPTKELSEAEIEARREAGLKKLLATPHKPHKAKNKNKGTPPKRGPKAS